MSSPHKPLASLRRSNAFRQVFQEGRHAASPFFVVYARACGGDSLRLGLSVSKKVGNAVVRNRIRRLIKESCRLCPPTGGFDYVVVARAAVAQVPKQEAFAKVSEALAQLFKRLALRTAHKNKSPKKP